MLAFLVQAVVTIAIGMLAFGASFPDQLISLIAALVLGAAAFAALGVAITGFIRRAEGASAIVNAIYFPVLFISGSFFAPSSFPTILERVADVLPVAYFIELVAAVCVRGESIWERPTDVAVVAAWGLGGAVVAVRKFRWTPTEG
jgi:ABC-2 type transport system permease protein